MGNASICTQHGDVLTGKHAKGREQDPRPVASWVRALRPCDDSRTPTTPHQAAVPRKRLPPLAWLNQEIAFPCLSPDLVHFHHDAARALNTDRIPPDPIFFHRATDDGAVSDGE